MLQGYDKTYLGKLQNHIMRIGVAQKDAFGCGIACVAFITGDSYKRAKNRYFNGRSNARIFSYICKDLVSALALAGKEYDTDI